MATLSEKLMQKYGVKPHPRSRAGQIIASQGVCHSSELARILALPRRPLEGEAPDLTPVYSKGVDRCVVKTCKLCQDGPPSLRPIQSQMLWEADRKQGLFSAAGVGKGKTLVTLLLHDALNATRTVLFIKPNLRQQLMYTDVPMYSRHFEIPKIRLAKSYIEEHGLEKEPPPGIYVMAYSELSLYEEWLEALSPDLVVTDEAHKFRRKTSARTKRLLRFFDDHEECRFCALTGSAMKRSIRDWAHLSELALRKDSPAPNGRTLFEWCCALDAHVEKPLLPGKLSLFCNPGEEIAVGVRRRFAESEGFVASPPGTLDTSLEIFRRELVLPKSVNDALNFLRATWMWEGEEIPDALSFARIAKQLACGFYYRWVWPNGEKDEEWLLARNNWHKEVRQYLKYHSNPGMDTLLQLANAAQAGRWKSEFWKDWALVKDRPEPPTETVWIDDQFFLADIEAWVADQKGEDGPPGCIVWYDYIAVGELLTQRYPVFWPGEKHAKELETATPGKYPVIVLSRSAYSEGKNLQAYSRNLVTTCPAAGDDWEQMLGRTHREGQLADTVTAEWYGHTTELVKAFGNAVKDAERLHKLQGPQKLMYADYPDMVDSFTDEVQE